MLSKHILTSVVAAIPFSWILFRCFVLVLRLMLLTRTFSACLWVMFLKADQRLRLFHRFLSMALMLLRWWDHFYCNSSWGIGMDDFAYTYTYTCIYIKADWQKHLSHSEVPSFEKFSEWTILGSFFLFNLGKKKPFPPSSKHPLPIISSPFSCL